MKKVIKLISVLLAVVMLLGIAGCTTPAAPGNNSTEPTGGDTPVEKEINEMTGLLKDPTILFLGDSITDGGRTDYSIKTYLGANHPKMVADTLRRMFRDENFTFYSTGVSGDTILDQYFRLQEDCFDLKPDYIVMMLGVNDAWSGYKGRETFEIGYRAVLDQIIANTNAKIVLVQPYLLPADDQMQSLCVIPSVNNYRGYVDEIGDVVCTLAAEYKLDVIYLPEILEQQHEKGFTYYQLAVDAIHPTSITAAILAEQIILKLGVKGFVPAYGEFDTSEVAAKYEK